MEGDELQPMARARLEASVQKLIVSPHDSDGNDVMEWEEWLVAYGRLDKAAALSGRKKTDKRDIIISVVRNRCQARHQESVN